MAVAYYSYRLARFTRLSFHWQELVRGALLHDYFLYDAQDGDPARKGHWDAPSPHRRQENAKQEMDLTPIEEDTIRCHMFPLTIKPPKYREGVVVSLVDKAGSVYEFFRRRQPYSKLRVHGARTADCYFAPSRDSGGEGLNLQKDVALPPGRAFFLAILLFFCYTYMPYAAGYFPRWKGQAMEKCKELFRNYKELILYVFFGGLTTVVNWVGYWLLADLLHLPYLWATAIAQIAAILFAYVTNRIWVFQSKAKGLGPVLGEMVRFFGCRGVSFVLDSSCMRIGVGALGINDMVMKFLSNVIVVIVNYVFSKLIVFRKPKQER